MSYSLYEHVLGGLLGQAWGDAFAMPAHSRCETVVPAAGLFLLYAVEVPA